MTKTLKVLLAAALVCGVFASTGVARADIENSTGTNVQEGDNRSTGRQSGRSASGDAVGGQVIGVVSAGRTSVDATNRSTNVDVSTGDAEGGNAALSFTGLTSSTPPEGPREGDISDITGAFATNLQEGDNRTSLSQSANATTGDGVGGQVAGVVTAAGGSASVVLANTTEDTSVETGDAEAFNVAAAFAGGSFGPPGSGPFGFCVNPGGNVPGRFRNRGICPPGVPFPEGDPPGGGSNVADIIGSCTEPEGCANVQEGDNVIRGSQSARASSGDGVGGQVIGVVSAGAASVDATNRTVDSFVETGDADSFNGAGAFAGLSTALVPAELPPIPPAPVDITGAFASNLQEGDNRRSFSQTADSSTGDAVAGQVAGVVTAAGGSASVVLANTSDGIDASTGESEFENSDAGFAGLALTGTILE